MSILATLAMSALPKLLLGAVLDWQKNKQLAEGSAENTRREVTLAAINAELERRRIRSEERRAAMEFPWFWWPWLIGTVSTTLWYALGVLDSTAMFGWLPFMTVHELPPQILAQTETIMVALYGTGGAVQLGQGYLRVLAKR